MALQQKEDRLCSLPDDILIGILNHFPTKLSIVTGCLSLRWKGLWKNSTSIHINSGDFRSKSELELVDDVNDIATQITSPFIHSFRIQIDSCHCYTPKSDWHPSMDRWFHEICVRNIRELKATYSAPYNSKLQFPSYIFQTQSLMSVDLDLPVTIPFVGDTINLPNLKNLRLGHCTRYHYDWLEKLIKACPSLEQLTICNISNLNSLNCSNQNVRRLYIGSGKWGKDTEIVINAPRLEYMDVRVSKFARIYFQEETTALREVKMGVSGGYSTRKPSFYQTVKDMASCAFQNVTRLSVDKNMFSNMSKLLTLVAVCPVLECLMIQRLHYFGVITKPATALSQVLKKIELEIYWNKNLKPTKLFSEFVESLLCNAINLEQLSFSVAGDGVGKDSKEDVKRRQKRELEVCNLLCRCLNVSMVGCDIVFIGKYAKMSTKAGPKACGENGKIILID